MEVTTQYSSASARTIAPDTLADQAPAVNPPPAQPKIFPEARTSAQFAPELNDGLSKRDLDPIGRTSSYVRANLSHPNDTLPREEPGVAPGACEKSAFRECRGGEALEANASSYVRFDQFDHKETAGNDGRGTCEGIVREALRRVDRNYGRKASNLRSVATSMRSEMSSGRSDQTNIYGRIQGFQSNPGSLALRNYRESSDADLNPYGRTSHAEATDGLMDSLSFMSRGGLAYIDIGIRHRDVTGPATSGHALLLQHLPADGRAGSRDRYTIFDPNNGAFTYNSLEKMQSSLRDYMKSAYTEDGDIATPHTIQFFTPPSSRAWASLPQTTSVPGRVDTNTLEPPELKNHRYGGPDRSQAKTGNQDPNADREKRGGVLGSCVTSEFRECRGGEALKDGSSAFMSFDQATRRETRGKNGRGTCDGIVREAIRRIDRNYSNSPRETVSSAVLSMITDMSTRDAARESGVFDYIAGFQNKDMALALRSYVQSIDMPLDRLSREDSLRRLTDNLNAMPPGGMVYVGIGIQSGGAGSPRDGGHALLIQRNPDVPAPDGTAPPHRYMIFDPNNGAFQYDTASLMNTALRNYMHTAYSANGSLATPERAIFYNPPVWDGRHRQLAPAMVPPAVDMPEPPGFLQPAPYPHDEMKKRSPPPPIQGATP